ncbi:MAG: UDP-3-O-(3-hydroxymyristoyl)glucosamine N-acyltransferase [Candidatus Cloacimonetes bacterium HGW-Cloacimonetes-1]|jgi:UDP-3-O-[3-hydroxymyristoyl] glucosamine N-acyltransferase|nr:MAG: UDP-3-O-(3-hydroxymyristoyl)glucosamine N-acyltransferase [Candidatus Cloacimonetes bacterium HGW-Cloacimonetes-1]
MKVFKTELPIQNVLSLLKLNYRGDTQLVLKNVAEPAEATPDSVIFWEQENYKDQVVASQAGLVITTDSYAETLGNRNVLIVEKPYFTMMQLITLWLHLDSGSIDYRIEPTSQVGEGTALESPVSIGSNVFIGANCKIGKYSVIEANTVIGDNVRIGQNCHVYPNCTIYADTVIGERVMIHSGAVIGADGFGYLLLDGIQQKIPQIGNVIIHNDVEIGANTTIDRATIGSTVVGMGTKIDNLVQIGHNCVIGKHSILCSQVGLAGSTNVGDYVYLAGQVGVAGHLSIGDAAMIGAQSGVASDIAPKTKMFGTPAREATHTMRIIAAEKHLPDMYRAYLKSLKQK